VATLIQKSYWLLEDVGTLVGAIKVARCEKPEGNMVSQTFIAKYKSEIVGRHTSVTPFTHAFIVLERPDLEEEERQYAYEEFPKNDDSPSARELYASLTETASGLVAGRYPLERIIPVESYLKKYLMGAASYDEWLALGRKNEIDEFEQKKADGYYKPKVGRWCRAEKVAMWTERFKNPWHPKVLAIVPAETETSV
jgi:hypothetical protein